MINAFSNNFSINENKLYAGNFFKSICFSNTSYILHLLLLISFCINYDYATYLTKLQYEVLFQYLQNVFNQLIQANLQTRR